MQGEMTSDDESNLAAGRGRGTHQAAEAAGERRPDDIERRVHTNRAALAAPFPLPRLTLRPLQPQVLAADAGVVAADDRLDRERVQRRRHLCCCVLRKRDCVVVHVEGLPFHLELAEGACGVQARAGRRKVGDAEERYLCVQGAGALWRWCEPSAACTAYSLAASYTQKHCLSDGTRRRLICGRAAPPLWVAGGPRRRPAIASRSPFGS